MVMLQMLQLLPSHIAEHCQLHTTAPCTLHLATQKAMMLGKMQFMHTCVLRHAQMHSSPSKLCCHQHGSCVLGCTQLQWRFERVGYLQSHKPNFHNRMADFVAVTWQLFSGWCGGSALLHAALSLQWWMGEIQKLSVHWPWWNQQPVIEILLLS